VSECRRGAGGPWRTVRYGSPVSTTAPGALTEWPQDGLESVDRCPACGGRPRSLLHSGLTDRSYLCAPGMWQLYRCTTCSAAYLDPRPDARTVHLAFATFYDGIGPPSADEHESGRWHRLRRALRNGYLASRYGYRVEPCARLGRALVPLLPRRREAIDELVRHLPSPGNRGRLLDVGCGEGDFLVAMTALGWEAEGLEPSEAAVGTARRRGTSVTCGTLPETPLPSESFEAVTFRLVLEYLREPLAGLSACRDALKPGGVLWIASPSLESEAHRVFGRDWIFLETPRHAVLFTPSALEHLVTRTGFDVLEVRPSRQAQWSFRMSNAIARGLPPFRSAPPLSLRLALRARLADVRALRRPELSDVFVLVARKR